MTLPTLTRTLQLRRIAPFSAALLCALVVLCPVLRAQDAGPQAPPPTYKVNRISGTPNPGPPPIPQEQIVAKFAANEDALKKAFDTFTFTQNIRMQELTDPGGDFNVQGQIYTKPDGGRYVRVVGQPASTLKVTHFSLEDVRQIASIPLFPLTSDEVAQYNFKYAGHVQLDQLNTYVFQVKPKLLSRKKRLFEGVIWVDDQDFAIVKSYGKFVSEFAGNGLSLPFTMFESYRENIDNKYWFPTYIRSDDFYKPDDNKNQPPGIPTKGRQRNGKPVQEQHDDTNLDDKTPKNPEDAPDAEDTSIPLRLVIRSSAFKVQTPADVPAQADSSESAPLNPSAPK
jgi:hypothetical protein